MTSPAVTVSDECKHALSMAKIHLMARPSSAFFSTLCFSMRFEWDLSIPTAATDGRTIFINPEAYMALTAGQRVSRLLHETLHSALMHLTRMGNRDPEKWNAACDYYINGELISKGFERIATWLYDPGYNGMSTEEIYALLPTGQKMPEDQKDLLKPSTEEVEALIQHTQDILVRASVQSKIANDKIGTIPGEIQIFINGLLDPKLPWNRILQKYLQAQAKHDYSFRKPNRRFFPKHHLPSLHSESLMNLAIAVDASGSVSPADFTVFVSEVHSILKMMKPEKITLVQFDTELKSVDDVRSVQELSKLTFTGRGGTDVDPVLEWANQTKPQLLLVFTDGYFRFSDLSTKVPVIWVVHNNDKFVAPFGKTIFYNI